MNYTVSNKQYYFLTGLPRSGNTLLSSLLNQHKDIYVSQISPLSSVLWGMEQLLSDPNVIRSESHFNRLQNILQDTTTNYYKDINKPIIIDREKTWGTPPNLSLVLKYITKSPKFIITLRSIPHIVCSSINLMRDHIYNG